MQYSASWRTDFFGHRRNSEFSHGLGRKRTAIELGSNGKYGMLDGVVKQVSADAHEKPESGNPAGKSAQEAAYRALINLSTDYLHSRGRQLRLVPGMQANAEIHLGTRSVLEFLLSPVQKMAHQAGRER